MKVSLKDRHLYGAGAAACTVCCAAPILTLLGIAGAAATVATFVFAGTVFALVVAIGSVLAVWSRRHQEPRPSDSVHPRPVHLELATTRTEPPGAD
ncbi:MULTISPECIES: hypothetical protein [unclassified Nocardioides]|uniref:hypothetical protein n=1 Tax=unclassified Nocardioides TaxID=2615069 RepID=UPI0006FC92CC|nr:MULTISPECIES: hypothetical protein [unclassified Nocardioides]KQY57381.1 hypothetical protein ASD30_14315 [Nocardioides sp. Root140]KQZ68894.1 hypothetical protein ASD66_16735 [Nocardioides sp. Root151]KRF20429.1 hypothetical protein ASH02_22250 [Nocardioides sp. Soil796]